MKVFFIFVALFSLNAFAGNGGDLMAQCRGTITGVETKINVYLNSRVFCETRYSGPYKGYIYLEDEATSYVYEAAINYKPGKYSAVVQVGPDSKIEVLFPNFNAPELVRATVNIEDNGERSSSSMNCELVEYQTDCKI